MGAFDFNRNKPKLLEFFWLSGFLFFSTRFFYEYQLAFRIQNNFFPPNKAKFAQWKRATGCNFKIKSFLQWWNSHPNLYVYESQCVGIFVVPYIYLCISYLAPVLVKSNSRSQYAKKYIFLSMLWSFSHLLHSSYPTNGVYFRLQTVLIQTPGNVDKLSG